MLIGPTACCVVGLSLCIRSERVPVQYVLQIQTDFTYTSANSPCVNLRTNYHPKSRIFGEVDQLSISGPLMTSDICSQVCLTYLRQSSHAGPRKVRVQARISFPEIVCVSFADMLHKLCNLDWCANVVCAQFSLPVISIVRSFDCVQPP